MHEEKLSPCTTQTLSNLASTTCTRGGVTFEYGPDPYAGVGNAPAADQISVVMDSNGPNATLIGNKSDWKSGWSVGPNEMWSFTIRYIVTGQTGKFSLAQLGMVATGDGSITATQFAGNVVSTITCTENNPLPSPSSGQYVQYSPATQPQDVGLTLTLNGGTNGSASIGQLSQHWQ